MKPSALVVSFHDLHPGTMDLCTAFLDDARSAGVSRVSLLAVPAWHGAPGFDKSPVFTEWLTSLERRGHEVCLHGLTHLSVHEPTRPVDTWLARVYAGGEGEFLNLGRDAAESRLREGMRLMKRSGFSPAGFVAPAWLLSPGTIEAARQVGFQYTTRLGTIHLLQQQRRLWAPTIAFSTRTRWRRLASLLMASSLYSGMLHASILRIAVHPTDLAYPAVYSRLSPSCAMPPRGDNP